MKSPIDLSKSSWYITVDVDGFNLCKSSNNRTHEPCCSAIWFTFDTNSDTVQVVPCTDLVPEIEYLAKSAASLKFGIVYIQYKSLIYTREVNHCL